MSKQSDAAFWRPICARLSELIALRIGIVIQERDFDQLQQFATERMRRLLGGIEDYENLLHGETPASKEEWNRLVKAFTIPETYFFRDKGHFNLLENVVFPQLIERSRGAKTLRIWSAGCSTGDEAYSMAILLHQMVKGESEFKVSIIATDLSKAALEKARKGIYSDWAFRMVDPTVREKYFQKLDGAWKLSDEIRSMVRFEQSNLVRDLYPDLRLGIYDLDLIVCRNVFIYFQRQTVVAVLEKFCAALKNGGYLITGHAEVYGNTPTSLCSCQFPEALIYQKDSKLVDRQEPPEAQPLRQSPREAPSSPLIGRSEKQTGAELNFTSDPASRLFVEQDAITPSVNPYSEAPAVEDSSPEWERFFKQAKLDADAGKYESATTWCHRTLQANPTAIQAYLLMAHIAEHENELENAKTYYRKVIYLAPERVEPYIHIAAILESERAFMRARKMRSSALELLQRMDKDAVVIGYEDVKVADLIDYLGSMLETPKGTASH